MNLLIGPIYPLIPFSSSAPSLSIIFSKYGGWYTIYGYSHILYDISSQSLWGIYSHSIRSSNPALGLTSYFIL